MYTEILIKSYAYLYSFYRYPLDFYNNYIYLSQTFYLLLRSVTHGTRKIDLHGNEVGCNLGSINHIALGNVVNYILESINSNKEEMISELIQEIKKL